MFRNLSCAVFDSVSYCSPLLLNRTNCFVLLVCVWHGWLLSFYLFVYGMVDCFRFACLCMARLIVFVLLVCVWHGWLFSFYLFVYGTVDCFRFTCLCMAWLIVFVLLVCVWHGWLFSFYLFVYGMVDCFRFTCLCMAWLIFYIKWRTKSIAVSEQFQNLFVQFLHCVTTILTYSVDFHTCVIAYVGFLPFHLTMFYFIVVYQLPHRYKNGWIYNGIIRWINYSFRFTDITAS
jgi:hypothetical protein